MPRSAKPRACFVPSAARVMDGALPAAFPAFEPVHGGDIPIIAGFECGRLHWSGHDLLHSTGHLTDAGMAHHYATAIGQGAAGARDGLSWRHDVVARVQAVPDGFPVIWDFCHFDLPPRPAAQLTHAPATEPR